MLTVIGILVSGIISGYILRRIPNLKFIGKLTLIFIFLLLFSLGISVGGNKIILNNLQTIGIQALLITFGAVTGSIILTTVMYRKLFKKDTSNER